MFDPITLGLLGAGAGALFNRKDPLNGALMGGALGAGGGMLSAPAAGSQAGMLAAQEAGLGSDLLGWGGATTGMQGAMNSAMGEDAGAKMGGLLGNIGTVQKPLGTAMNAAQMFQQGETPPPQPIPVNLGHGSGAQVLGQLAGQNQQAVNQQLQDDYMKRLEQKKRIAMMGGNYGGFA